ncbi:MAG: adenosylcobinamide-GDP ribazoletransferase [Yoonia sp.]|uniref:adenosylcobinamide-GDP ribazoletransferase n=1 Tax=Yoonia sp. TaxID=2212373 RepID=UPI003EF5AC74
MYKDDQALIDRVDLPAAVGLLTRLPVVLDTNKAMARGAASAWAYPLVGVMLGVGLAVLASALLGLGLTSGITAALVLAASVIVTGAMHEDGLADCADGFWGGWDKARRLAIMKDSHIGVYGVCAIVLGLLIRWLALNTIIGLGWHWMALIAVGALSRGAMVGVMAILPNAREGGLSRQVGRPPSNATLLAFGLAAFVALLSGHIGLIVLAAFIASTCAMIAKAKIGGQTGDVLGATQQITEMGLLAAIVAGAS